MSSALHCNCEIVLMSVLLKPNDSMHINLKIDANALEPVNRHCIPIQLRGQAVFPFLEHIF